MKWAVPASVLKQCWSRHHPPSSTKHIASLVAEEPAVTWTGKLPVLLGEKFNALSLMWLLLILWSLCLSHSDRWWWSGLESSPCGTGAASSCSAGSQQRTRGVWGSENVQDHVPGGVTRCSLLANPTLKKTHLRIMLNPGSCEEGQGVWLSHGSLGRGAHCRTCWVLPFSMLHTGGCCWQWRLRAILQLLWRVQGDSWS